MIISRIVNGQGCGIVSVLLNNE